ncbi:MAG: HypC/HybG/HupF family hydrogenase formation chaperone [Actinomycetota bacterium]|nr:HypC/HybG/HupF family hydrogenase formation chaperone [Actinomycetota bacterium]
MSMMASKASGATVPGATSAGDPYRCDHEVCITCGDVAVAMQAVSVDPERGLALCRAESDGDGDGDSETVETELVAPVRAGDRLLVHAGTAIARLDDEESEPG